MTIGRMQLPTINAERYKWYQKRKHRRIPSIGESKKWIDQFWTKVYAISAPIAVGTLTPWPFTENTGNKFYNASVGFSGSGIVYSLVTAVTGFSINAIDGSIVANSAVTGSGVKTLTIRATNIAGAATQVLTVNIGIAAPIAVGTLAGWSEVQTTGNKTYNASIGFSGQSLTYSLPTGATGISINSATGVLTADTSVVTLGAHSLVVRATNVSGFANQPLTMTIVSGLTPPVTVGTIGPWNIIQNSGNQTFNAASGFSGSTITYSLQVGATGFSINGSTGVITANTATTGTGAKSLTVRATNGAGFADQPLTVNVAIAAPTVVGTLGPWNITEGTGNQTLATAAGFTGASLTYSLSVGATGFSINSATGVVTANTATTGNGIKSITVRVTNVSGFADQPVTVNIAIAAPTVVGTLGPWNANRMSGNQTFPSGGGFTGSALTYSLQVGGSGISISSTTGVVTVNTNVVTTGTHAITVRATNVSGFVDQPVNVVLTALPIAFIAATASQSNGIAPPAGDILNDFFACFSFNTASSTPITLAPPDWLQLASANIINHLESASPTAAGIWGYKICDNPGLETNAGWTGAATNCLGIYRNVDLTSPILAANFQIGTGDNVSFPALTYSDPNAWVLLACRPSASITPSVPAGFTSRGAGTRRLIADSNAPRASFAGVSVTMTGAVSWITAAMAIRNTI